MLSARREEGSPSQSNYPRSFSYGKHGINRRRAAISHNEALQPALAAFLLFSITALAGEKGKAVTVKGWVSDTECAAHGDKKCANKEHLKMGSKRAWLPMVTTRSGPSRTLTSSQNIRDTTCRSREIPAPRQARSMLRLSQCCQSRKTKLRSAHPPSREWRRWSRHSRMCIALVKG